MIGVCLNDVEGYLKNVQFLDDIKTAAICDKKKIQANFRAKHCHSSVHNRLTQVSAMLKGQTGHDSNSISANCNTSSFSEN